MASQINQPANIDLQEEALSWTVVQGDWKQSLDMAERDDFVHRDTAGCLADFVRLAQAEPGQILDFARRRGVLAVAPLWVQGGSLQGLEPGKCYYLEELAVYRQLAMQAKSLLELHAAFREGKALGEILLDQSLYLSCFPQVFQAQESACLASLTKTTKPRWVQKPMLYYNLLQAVRNWTEVASYKLLLDTSAALSCIPGNRYCKPSTPSFTVDFGEWSIANAWEIAAHPVNPCSLPSKYQRPSPLFNVLAYQLGQALTLPEGYYECSRRECGRLYFYDRKLSDIERLDSGKPNENYGMSKPRGTSEVSYCSAACRSVESNKRKNEKRTEYFQAYAAKARQKTPAGQ